MTNVQSSAEDVVSSVSTSGSVESPAATTFGSAPSPALNLPWRPELHEYQGLEADDDFMQEQRHFDLHAGLRERCGGEGRQSHYQYSATFLLEQAAQRYFLLMRDTQAALRGRFTSVEFLVLLSTHCHPMWPWHPTASLAQTVINERGRQRPDYLPEDDPLRTLIEKLETLTPIEAATVVDACEQVWRGHANPLL